MLTEKVYVSFFLDASRPNAEGKCLIKMSVYQRPSKVRYATKFHLSKDDWEKLNGPKLRDDNLRKIKRELNLLKDKVDSIIEKLVPFSFITFEELFEGKDNLKKSIMVSDWFDDSIKSLKANDQIETASSYNTANNRLIASEKILNFMISLQLSYNNMRSIY